MLADDDRNIDIYQHDGIKYNLVRKAPLPDGAGWHCSKAVSDTTIFLQRNNDHPTYQVSIADQHQHMDRLNHKGGLRGILHPNTLVYGQMREYDDWVIILHQPDGDITLQPPDGRKWDAALSVCKAGEYVLVVERYTKSMDAFSMRGKVLLFFVWFFFCHT